MATDVSVRIASTTNHGNLRFSPRVAKRARCSGSAFLCRGTQSTYSKYDISATLKSSCEIFRLAVKSLRDMRCILLSCTSKRLL